MMSLTDATLPPAVSRDEWLAARRVLLAKEQALTRQRDAVNAERRRLPMGRSDGPFMHWVRRHDRYAPDAAPLGTAACCGDRV